MYARVARFEGGPDWSQGEYPLDQIRQSIAEAKQALQSGSLPEGFDEKGARAIARMVLLLDRGSGEAYSIALCDSEDDAREADRMLSAMSPPGGGSSGRVGTPQVMEVVIDEAMR